MSSQEFCLKWNNHQGNLLDVFGDLLLSEELVDVTLTCQGLCFKVHKVVLSACSSFFRELFHSNPCQHPIIFMNDVNYADLKAVIQFMYKGEVNVSQEQLPNLLKIGEALKVKGLAEVSSDKSLNVESNSPPKTKHHSSDSPKQISKDKENESPKRPTEEKLMKKTEKVTINPDCCMAEKNNSNVFASSIDDSNVTFSQQSVVNSVSSCQINDSPITSQSIKNSPNSSPDHSNDNDNSCVDPNQYLLQQFSCPESNLSSQSDENPTINNNMHSQSIFPGGSHPPFDASPPNSQPSSSSFPPNIPFLDHSSFTSSVQPTLNQSSTNLQPYSNNTVMNMNAVGLTMAELSAVQECTTPDKSWRTRGRPASWSQETLHCAMTAVLKDGWSVTAAARKFGIPQPTLHSYISKFYRRRQAVSSIQSLASRPLLALSSSGSNPPSTSMTITPTCTEPQSPQSLVIDLPQSPSNSSNENPSVTLHYKGSENEKTD
ncbi:Protein bric-a-brac 2 [Nymphon striatum]|nr:Protein bric-a-brac 2 [Nymphon striatum]